jgi:hypothetical protein
MTVRSRRVSWAGRPKLAEKKKARHFPTRLVAHFAIAWALSYGLELWLHHAITLAGQSHNVLTESVFEIATSYHHIVTGYPRKPAPRFTSLVTLSAEASPPGISLLNVCAERRFLGEVLQTLTHVHPTVVVLDKFFGANTCPADDPGTQKLIEGMQALCENHVKVVVGRNVHAQAQEEQEHAGVYPLDAGLSFNPPATCVVEGIANLDLDNRRVSLWWPNVAPVNQSHSTPPSIALAAALAAKPRFLESGRLAGWSPDAPPPYVSFLERGQFASYDIAARDMVCSAPGTPGWRSCSDSELKPEVREKASGTVVMIGEDFPDVDRHETVVGDTPGYILQANYVESLLDDRLIRPVPNLLNIAVGFLIFATFQYLVWLYHRQESGRVKAVIVCGIFVLLGCAFLSLYLIVALLGYYLNPTTISVLAILVLSTDMLLMPGEHSRTGKRAK